MRNSEGYLSKREQQIMDLAYEHECLTTALLTEKLPGAPAGSTVRTLLKILEDKGHLRHIEEDGKNIYYAINPKQSAGKQALARVVQTFFKGSVSDVVAALLSDDGSQLTEDEIGRLRKLIERAKEEGK